ncbi:hypothetical protein EYF80_012542 [Liparis tanakae]|uniref:Uncharacterized protein n=1 Tax=Liparis tanakae TaxID=230148 RepID=A0A4Z2IHR7_9TELE|nr:hypothetical protein EYF80_012542 [Liparis tanakae]
MLSAVRKAETRWVMDPASPQWGRNWKVFSPRSLRRKDIQRITFSCVYVLALLRMQQQQQQNYNGHSMNYTWPNRTYAAWQECDSNRFDRFCFPYSVHVQRVHGEVVGVHAEVVEDFLERERLAALLQHHAVGLRLVRGLDELQQVLLVHAGGGVDVRVHLRRESRADDSRGQ